MPLNPRQLDFSVLGQGLNKLFAGKKQPSIQDEMNQLQLEQMQHAKRQREQQGIFTEDESRQKAMFQDSQEAATRLGNKDYAGVISILESRVKALNEYGGDPSETLEMLDMMKAGEYGKAKSTFDMFNEIGRNRGYLKALEPVKDNKADIEFSKEERQYARDSVKSFNKSASEVRTSYGKVESILKSDKLNRMQIASAMTSMARLLSPGIVTNQDFQNLSNSSNPVAQVLSTLTGKGAAGAGVAEELQRYVDPTNPDLFDKEAFLKTARATVGASIPAMLDTYNGASDRAKRGGMSERAYQTNFASNKHLSALTEMMNNIKPVITNKAIGDITEAQIQKAMKDEGMTREEVIAFMSDI